MNPVLQLVYNYLIAYDQLMNALLLGHPDETLSSRLGRAKDKERYTWVRWLRIAIDALFWFDTKVVDGKKLGHCEKSVMPLEQQNFRTVADYEIWSWQHEQR